MKKNLVITISREFGSGGHKIGELLAKELNIPFYDKKIIDKAAEKTGLTSDFIAEHEQRYTSSLMFNLAMGNYSRTGELPLHDKIDIVESDIIRDYASQGSCVIIGRCADYVTISVVDADDEIMSVKLFVADYDQALAVKERFLEDPVRIYSNIVALLLA